MFIKRIKTLPPSFFLKISMPIIVLLCVFFIKSMIESNTQSFFQSRYGSKLTSLGIDVSPGDREFIKALLESAELKEPKPFSLADYMTNPFIYGFRNAVKPEQQINAELPHMQEGTPVIGFVPPMPTYVVSAVFNGKIRKYAVINNQVASIGSVFENGDRVISVDDGRVLIKGQWGKQWFYVSY